MKSVDLFQAAIQHVLEYSNYTGWNNNGQKLDLSAIVSLIKQKYPNASENSINIIVTVYRNAESLAAQDNATGKELLMTAARMQREPQPVDDSRKGLADYLAATAPPANKEVDEQYLEDLDNARKFLRKELDTYDKIHQFTVRASVLDVEKFNNWLEADELEHWFPSEEGRIVVEAGKMGFNRRLLPNMEDQLIAAQDLLLKHNKPGMNWGKIALQTGMEPQEVVDFVSWLKGKTRNVAISERDAVWALLVAADFGLTVRGFHTRDSITSDQSLSYARVTLRNEHLSADEKKNLAHGAGIRVEHFTEWLDEGTTGMFNDSDRLELRRIARQYRPAM